MKFIFEHICLYHCMHAHVYAQVGMTATERSEWRVSTSQRRPPYCWPTAWRTQWRGTTRISWMPLLPSSSARCVTVVRPSLPMG